MSEYRFKTPIAIHGFTDQAQGGFADSKYIYEKNPLTNLKFMEQTVSWLRNTYNDTEIMGVMPEIKDSFGNWVEWQDPDGTSAIDIIYDGYHPQNGYDMSYPDPQLRYCIQMKSRNEYQISRWFYANSRTEVLRMLQVDWFISIGSFPKFMAGFKPYMQRKLIVTTKNDSQEEAWAEWQDGSGSIDIIFNQMMQAKNKK